MTRPNAIGIGAQKCASSWIHAVIAAHPAAAVAEEKELDFFSYYFDRGYGWYQRHFEGLDAAAIRFEASPSYFHDPRSPQRVAEYDPAMRIVALLRDPVDRAFSNHLHEIIKGHIPAGTPFEDGLANNPSYLEQSRYGTHLGRWLDTFPRDQVLVLLAEEIRADTEGQAERLFGFLGIDTQFRSKVLTERRNESDRARFALLRRVLRAQGQQMRRLGLEEQLIRLKQTPPFRQLLAANSVDVRAEVPRMRPETRQRLIAALAPEMETLAARTGLPLAGWPSWQALAGGAAQQPAAG